MKTGTIIAGILITAGVGTAAYVAYQKYKGTSSAPTGPLTPTTTSNGVQAYVDQAGKVFDQAGNILSTAQNIIKSVSGTKLSSRPSACPADFNGAQYLINNPDVAKSGDKYRNDPCRHWREWGWQEGRSWTVGDPIRLGGLGCACNDNRQVMGFNLLN